MDENIRKASSEDLSAIYNLVKELASFEEAENEVTTTIEDYQRDFKDGIFDALVARSGKNIVGMALFYISYSSWKGKMMHLEDFIVSEKYRNKGLGLKIFEAVIEEARNSNCRLLRWEVLDWNKNAIRFYERHGATIEKNWWNGKIVF